MCLINKITSFLPKEKPSKETKDQTAEMSLPGDTGYKGEDNKAPDNHRPERQGNWYGKDEYP